MMSTSRQAWRAILPYYVHIPTTALATVHCWSFHCNHIVVTFTLPCHCHSPYLRKETPRLSPRACRRDICRQTFAPMPRDADGAEEDISVRVYDFDVRDEVQH